ncbi:hypothetical protein AMATHDRAFT_146307, partial [Amanita thiersii Skay4041]
LLAPLIDMMATPDIDKRFTANQALEFFLTLRSEMSEKELKCPIPRERAEKLSLWDGFSRWNGLSTEFVQRWEAYRELPPSLPRRLLRTFCKRHWGRNIIYYTRLIFQRIRNLFFFWQPTPIIRL